jgi:hypothetical protein
LYDWNRSSTEPIRGIFAGVTAIGSAPNAVATAVNAAAAKNAKRVFFMDSFYSKTTRKTDPPHETGIVESELPGIL